MALRRLIEGIAGVKPGEADPPAAPPVPRPPPGGGGRTPYPGYDAMAPDKWRHDWDDKTRRVVLDRLRHVPARAFFSEAEFATLAAACARLLPQDDRPAGQRIPLAPPIDQRLANGEGNGYRYEGMPWDDEAYHRGLAGLDEARGALYGGQGFAALDPGQQDVVLAAVADGEPPGETWRRLPAQRFFKLLTHDVVEAYYAHPAAWNEIGFQGPASPRGHVRLALGKRDPWEADETAPLPPQERARVGEAPHGSAAGSGGATH